MGHELKALAANPQRGFSSFELEELQALFSVLESLATELAPRISAIAEGIAEVLGQKAAEILCRGAKSPADVAQRFFRLQAAIAAHEILATARS
jgi:hypothetical protein